MKQFIWLDENDYHLGLTPPENKIVVEIDLPLDKPMSQDLLEHYFECGQKQVV